MIQYLDEYLQAAATPARRGVLLQVALVLESILGESIYVSIDELLHRPESVDYNQTVDEISESLLASLEVAFAQFGLYFDEELIEPHHLTLLADTLEALGNLESNEDRDYILSIIEGSTDHVEALVATLECVSPGIALGVEELVYRVDPQLMIALKNALREPARREPAPEFDEKAAAAYIQRCQEFRKKFGRPPIVGELIEHKANLKHHPDLTFKLVAPSLDTKNAPQTAWELYALVVYSNCESAEITTTVERLIVEACADQADVLKIQDEFRKLLGR